MASVLNLYMDDSGSRNPDHQTNQPPRHGYDWFGLGGILIKEEDEDLARSMINDFRAKWPKLGDAPFHSTDIRNKTGEFRWLLSLDQESQRQFYNGLSELLIALPVIGIACVIDRPGYNYRYRDKYGRQRWSLCKTAFTIAVERAAKYALSQGRKLRVLPELCSKKADKKLKGYFDHLKSSGLPFDSKTSGAYNPLANIQFDSVLYEFRLKAKSSPLAQVADLYLWAMCIGGYHKSNRSYSWLKEHRKIIDCLYPAEEIAEKGIKYSCFDLVEPLP